MGSGLAVGFLGLTQGSPKDLMALYTLGQAARQNPHLMACIIQSQAQRPNTQNNSLDDFYRKLGTKFGVGDSVEFPSLHLILTHTRAQTIKPKPIEQSKPTP